MDDLSSYVDYLATVSIKPSTLSRHDARHYLDILEIGPFLILANWFVGALVRLDPGLGLLLIDDGSLFGEQHCLSRSGNTD